MITFLLPNKHKSVVIEWLNTNCKVGTYGLTQSQEGSIIVSLMDELDITHFRIAFCDDLDGFLEL